MNNNHNVFPCNELGMGDSKSELERLLELCESTPQTGEPNPQIANMQAFWNRYLVAHLISLASIFALIFLMAVNFPHSTMQR